jgi:hypothetical protein
MVAGVGGIVVVVLVALGLLLAGGGGDRRTAAVLGVVVVLIPAVTALVGTFVTRQAEQRQEFDRQQTERRLELEHQDQEERLRLEAAMRAGALFNPDGENPADPAAVASGLLSLTRLGRADLAVALLVDLWHARLESADKVSEPSPASVAAEASVRGLCVSDETAVLVLDDALRSTRRAQLVAAELLCRKADQLDICQSLHWPSALDGQWNPDFSVRTKVLIVEALIRMATRRDADQNALQSLAVRLYTVSAGDPDRHVRGCLGILLDALVPALVATGVTSLMQGPTEISISDIVDAAKQAEPNPDLVFFKIAECRANKLREWASGCTAVDMDAGALAAATISW